MTVIVVPVSYNPKPVLRIATTIHIDTKNTNQDETAISCKPTIS